MMTQSKAEKEFKLRYPGARTVPEVMYNGKPARYLVRVGGYPVATGRTRPEAYRRSMEYVEAGVSTPDPNEGTASCRCGDEDCPVCTTKSC